MPQEVRVLREGEFRWVQGGSGTGGNINTGWITGASPASGVFGFIAGGIQYSRDFTLQTVFDRGFPKHNKLTQYMPVEVTVPVLYATTADWPPMQPFVTASGFSLPMWHLEFKMHKPEVAGKEVPFLGTGEYIQFHNASMLSFGLNENENGNTVSMKFRALAAVGPTASGFLS